MPGAVQQRGVSGLGGCLPAIGRSGLGSQLCQRSCDPLRADSTPGPPQQAPHSQHSTEQFPRPGLELRAWGCKLCGGI